MTATIEMTPNALCKTMQQYTVYTMHNNNTPDACISQHNKTQGKQAKMIKGNTQKARTT